MKGRFKRFIIRNSFFITLGLCVCVFMACGIYVANKISGLNEETETVAVSQTPDIEIVSQPNTDESGLPEKAENKLPEEDTEIDKSSETVAVAADVFEMQSPLEGTIITPHTNGELIYSATMADMRAHNGIDIAGEMYAPVCAVEDGVVSDITDDPLYGITIVLDHKNGFVSKYSGIITAGDVSLNKEVKKGQKISELGDAIPAESADGVHLHFEIQKDGVQQNPGDYIKF